LFHVIYSLTLGCFQVLLKTRGRGFCGGIIIKPLWVLTASHCLEDIQAQNLQVVAGNLSVNLSPCLFNGLSLYLSVCVQLSQKLSPDLTVYLSVYLSTYPFVYLSTYLSVCLQVSMTQMCWRELSRWCRCLAS